MKIHDPLHWLTSITICGREGEEDDPFERDDKGEILVEDDEQVLKDGWELDDDGKPAKVEDPDDKSEEGDEGNSDAKVKALEESLRKERQLRRKAERDAKRNAKKRATDSTEKEEEETKKQLEQAMARTERLAAGLKKKEIESAVLTEARKQGFIDPTDALTSDVLKEIDADQDEDDPTDIDIDMDSVKDAVKDLAARKKHLVGSGTPETPSGSKFSRKGKGNSDSGDDNKLREHYPSLR